MREQAPKDDQSSSGRRLRRGGRRGRRRLRRGRGYHGNSRIWQVRGWFQKEQKRRMHRFVKQFSFPAMKIKQTFWSGIYQIA